MATDLLACTVLTPPGEMGVDVVGTNQVTFCFFLSMLDVWCEL